MSRGRRRRPRTPRSSPPHRRPPARARRPFPTYGTLLFDLESDPTETTDLAPANPDIVARLRAIIEALNATAVPSAGVCAGADPGQNPAKHNGTCVPWTTL